MVVYEIAKSVKDLVVFIYNVVRFIHAKRYVLAYRHYEGKWSYLDELLLTLMFP